MWLIGTTSRLNRFVERVRGNMILLSKFHGISIKSCMKLTSYVTETEVAHVYQANELYSVVE